MIPLYRSYSDEADIAAVSGVIRDGMHWTEGPNVDRFEAALCEYLGVPGTLVCNSGTSALHLALLACGVNWRHEVIVPSFTFIATANAVRFVGATPVFADIEETTCGLDPADVECKITSKTKAIIAVHYGGQPCRIVELRKIADQHKLLLIEDACEALGAEVDHMPVGRFGDCAVFSFCANKIISTGEGGALVTGSRHIYERARLIRSHGRETGSVQDGGQERYTCLGYNWRLSGMQAALGLSQLRKIDQLISMRREIADWYCDRLGPLTVYQGTGNVFQLFTTRICDGHRDIVMHQLYDRSIGCKVYFRPVHLTDFYRQNKWQPEHLPVTERVSSQVLSLPIYPGLTEGQVEYICKTVIIGIEDS